MNEHEAYRAISDRVRELIERDDVKNKMLKIANEKSKEDAEQFVYRLAIATLMGVEQ